MLKTLQAACQECFGKLFSMSVFVYAISISNCKTAAIGKSLGSGNANAQLPWATMPQCLKSRMLCLYNWPAEVAFLTEEAKGREVDPGYLLKQSKAAKSEASSLTTAKGKDPKKGIKGLSRKCLEILYLAFHDEKHKIYLLKVDSDGKLYI